MRFISPLWRSNISPSALLSICTILLVYASIIGIPLTWHRSPSAPLFSVLGAHPLQDPNVLQTAECVEGLVVIHESRHLSEGIGAIAMLFKQTARLAHLLGGTPSSSDYYSDHGYMVSEVLPRMVKTACARKPNVCRLSKFISQQTYEHLTTHHPLDEGDQWELHQLNETVIWHGCNILLVDLENEHRYDDTDILRYAIDEGIYATEVFGPKVVINAHVRWGDTSTGSDWYSYGRDKTCNLTSAALAARQALHSGRQVRINVFTETGLDGSMPPLDELEGLEEHISMRTDTEAKEIVRQLGDCDIFVGGGSQLSVLVAYSSRAKLAILPNHQVVYIEDAEKFGTKYLTSGMLEEDLEGWFSFS